MKIEMFTDTYTGFVISSNDFEFYLSRPAVFTVLALAAVVVTLRVIKKVRDAR